MKIFNTLCDEWTNAEKLCKTIELFHIATATESGSHHVPLCITRRIYEMFCNAIDDFEDIEIATLGHIASHISFWRTRNQQIYPVH